MESLLLMAQDTGNTLERNYDDDKIQGEKMHNICGGGSVDGFHSVGGSHGYLGHHH